MKTNTKTQPKPFLKWAGGKTQLLATLDSFLPPTFPDLANATYIEPFVGGGAMLFHMLQKYKNISKAVINDINPRLIKAYAVIRDEPDELIAFLENIQDEYRKLRSYLEQKEFYLNLREKFNNDPTLSDIAQSGILIFMNRTCFNGLYRENRNGMFNSPFGKYPNPTICDWQLIEADSYALQKVTIMNGDFTETEKYAAENTLFYFDPPYRPLCATSNFNTYVKQPFGDAEQIRLKEFFSRITEKGHYALLSNSDGKSINEDNTFMDDLYKDFIIESVNARRSINANPLKRGKLTELLIRNYKEKKNWT